MISSSSSSSSLSFFRRIGITATTVAFTLTLFYYGRTTSIQAFSSASSSSSFAAPSLFSLAQQHQQQQIPSSCSSSSSSALQMLSSSSTTSATTATTKVIPSWDELKTKISLTSVGKALDVDKYLRSIGKGSPNVHNKLRLFNDNKEDNNSSDDYDDSKDNKETNTKTKYTIYRDHAGWCPYCQKTMLLIEAKNIPISIELINMRSYGDKPNSFLRKVPNGLLPALEENGSNSNKVILDSAYIMEYLENEYSSTNDNENYKQMIPSPSTQPEQYQRYTKLMNLERELFSWWCTFMFRQEQPNPNLNKSNSNNNSGGNSNSPIDLLSKMFSTRDKDGNYIENEDANEDSDYVSPSMNGFLNCLETVNTALSATDGSYFLDYTIDHPTMIDFIFASHIERMIASCAYWKGMNIRCEIEYPKLFAIQKWMNSLEKYDYYLAFKSDYYTHIKDIPPQYGPSSYGVSRLSKIKQYKLNIDGGSDSWTLPLSDDDTLQPLYNGIPLPKPVLESVNIKCDNDGSYKTSGSKNEMKLACQLMAVWKLCGNGPSISKFASRGGPNGSKNIRKTFGAELADPYAESDTKELINLVDEVLRIIGLTMIEQCEEEVNPNTIPGSEYESLLLRNTVNDSNNKKDVNGIITSLVYLRDRIGVPRDLPLASARYLRAYLNWAIDVLRVQQ